MNRVLAFLFALLLASPALAQSASITPNAMTQFVDQNGAPYAGGFVYFYLPNTTTPSPTWQDPYETTLNANPVHLDSAGRAAIWGSGVYRQVLVDQYNNTIWDRLTTGVNLPAGTGTGELVYQNNPTIISPILTGTPTAPTAGSGTNTTQVATTAFVQSAVNAAITRAFINVTQPPYNATGNGTTNDGAALQSALLAGCSQPNPGTIYIPRGTYLYTAALQVTCAEKIIGDGTGSELLPASSIDAIDATSTGELIVEDLLIHYAAPASSGTIGINVHPASGVVAATLIDHVEIDNAYWGAEYYNCVHCHFDRNHVYTFGSIGFYNTTDLADVDNGDNEVTNSYFFNYSSIGTQVGIEWAGGGGLRVLSNKFGALGYGILVKLQTGGVTAQMYVIGNSFDTMNIAGLTLQRQGSTGTFANVVYNDNICTGCVIGLYAPTDANNFAWLTLVAASGNTYIGQNASNCFGYSIDSANNVTVLGGGLISNNSASVAVTIGSGVTGGNFGQWTKTGTWGSNFNGGTSTNLISPD